MFAWLVIFVFSTLFSSNSCSAKEHGMENKLLTKLYTNEKFTTSHGDQLSDSDEYAWYDSVESDREDSTKNSYSEPSSEESSYDWSMDWRSLSDATVTTENGLGAWLTPNPVRQERYIIPEDDKLVQSTKRIPNWVFFYNPFPEYGRDFYFWY